MMGVFRSSAGIAAALALLAAMPNVFLADAQQASPAPQLPPMTAPAAGAAADLSARTSKAAQNAAIVRPLLEIGRVHARSRYCAALLQAGPGVEAALDFEYDIPIVASHLSHFRVDSYLTREMSSRQAEQDMKILWGLATYDREHVIALREAAKQPGIDPQRRDALTGLADALDGAKGREIVLTRALAKFVGAAEELPVRNIASSASDDHGISGVNGAPRSPVPIEYPGFGVMNPYAFDDYNTLENLFDVFTPEEYIRSDLSVAAQHATAAVRLGGCNL